MLIPLGNARFGSIGLEASRFLFINKQTIEPGYMFKKL
ncbi:hypothetical protein ADICYQ_4957 [Cyclobacterium qasimii M12-11B]|uniref:Uncharacterized protein n=1 Tax=Cyclobacterium qasimii M12-11B TaxID=641524 RepID=S7WPD3_9BACT|nr:hypothetical protein ADICYQ_4957 [Cyclobacterium qasimii M12-11B]